MENEIRARLEYLQRGEVRGPRSMIPNKVKAEQVKDAAREEDDEELSQEAQLALCRKELASCFESVQKCALVASRRVVSELALLLAESAFKLGDLNLTQQAVEMFFVESTIEDQFFCRGLFLKALLCCEEAKRSGSLESVEWTCKGIGHIVKAVDICIQESKRDSYAFLVYNASVHLWRVMKPILRNGFRANAVPGLTKICDALEMVKDENLFWRARLLRMLAVALEEKGDLVSAQTTVKKALELLKKKEEEATNKNSSEQVKSDIYECTLLSVHLGKQASLAVAKSTKASGDIGPTLQCVRSNLVPGGAVAVESELEDALRLVEESTGTTGGEGVPKRTMSIINIGQLALRNESFDLATRCLLAVLKVPPNKRSAKEEAALDFFRCEWLSENPDSSVAVFSGKTSSIDSAETSKEDTVTSLEERNKKRAALQLAKRMQALKIIEHALLSCKRLSAPELLEEGCIVTWNISLPLLQPSLKKHVHRVFQVAAKALEEIDSPLAELRAHFHSEIAKCEVASDFLTKASAEVEKALKLHVDIEQKANHAPSISKFLKPLQDKLRVKSNVYYEPENNIEQAMLQIEQAKDAKDVYLKKTLLNKAVSLLCEPCKEDSADLNQSEEARDVTEQADLDKKRVILWSEIVELAWEVKLLPITVQAATTAVELSQAFVEQVKGNPEFSSDVVEIQRLRVQINFLLADTFAERVRHASVHDAAPFVANLSLRALGLRLPCFVHADFRDLTPEAQEELLSVRRNLTQVRDLDACTWDASNGAPHDPALLDWKEGVINHILSALSVAKEIEDSVLIENAATYLWNYHLHMFNGPLQRYQFAMPKLAVGLLQAQAALRSIPVETRDANLFASLTAALVQSLEGLSIAQQGQASNDVDPRLGQTASEKQSKAVELCKAALTECPIEYSRDLFAALQRIQRRKGTPEPLPSDPIAQGYAVLELLRLPNQLVKPEEKKQMLEKTMDLLFEHQEEIFGDFNKLLLGMELWARYARESLELGLVPRAERAATRVLEMVPRNERLDKPDAEQDQDANKTSAAMVGKLVPKQWRWISLGEVVIGKIRALQASQVLHDKTVQDSLRTQALMRFVAAGDFAIKSKQPKLVLDTARELWNVARLLLTSVVGRSAVFYPLKRVLEQLRKVGESTDMELRLFLYRGLFECFKDDEDWEGGLAAVKESFKVIPVALQKPLWEAHVIFSSKLNRDVAAGLHRMKEGNSSLQAKAWVTLARSSGNVEDQLNAYVHALELLKDSFERRDYLIEFAEWLHANHFPRDQVTQCLVAAADILLDVQHAVPSTGKDSPTSPSSRAPSRMLPSSLASQSKLRLAEPRELGEPCFDAPSKLGLSHYLQIVQIFTMLSRVVSHSRTRFDMTLAAHEYLVQTWNRFVFNVPADESQQEEDKNCWLERCLFAAETEAIATSAELQVEAVQVPRLSLILHYLLELADSLQECGHHLLSLTSLSMLKLLCHFQQQSALKMLAELKLVRALSVLNLNELAKKQLQHLRVILDEEERAKYSVEVEQIIASGVNETTASRRRKSSVQLSGHAAPTKRKEVNSLKIRETWSLIATELVALGYTFQARQFLHEVRRHNLAYNDYANMVRSCLAEAKLAILEGKEERALETVLEGMNALRKSGGGDVLEWLKNVQALIDCLQRLDRGGEKVEVLAESFRVYEEKLRTQGSIKDLDLEVAACYVQSSLAEQVLRDVISRARAGRSWAAEWKAFQSHVRDSQDRILIATKPYCASLAAMEILMKHCKLWQQVYEEDLLDQKLVAFSQIADGLQRASRCADFMLQMVLPVTQTFGAKFKDLSLPIERCVGDVQEMLGHLEVRHASFLDAEGVAVQDEGNGEVGESKTSKSVVDEWLLSTAPRPKLASSDLCPDAKARACAHLMSACSHFRGVQTLEPRALFCAGSGLAQIGQRGDLDIAQQAIELLQESIELGVKQKQFDIVGAAAFELVKLTCALQHQGASSLLPFTSFDGVKGLILFQSLQNRSWLEQVLKNKASDRKSKLSFFYRLEEMLRNELVTPDLQCSPEDLEQSPSPTLKSWPYSLVNKYLRSNVAMQRLDCTASVDDMLAVCSPSCVYSILSLSNDFRQLYCTMFSKETCERVRVIQRRLSLEESHKLQQTMQAMDAFQKRIPSFLLGHEKNESYDFKPNDLHDALEQELAEICTAMRALLSPSIEAAASRLRALLEVEDSAEGQKHSFHELDLVVMADESLLRLPLEHLFEGLGCRSISREFSFHMLHHRLCSIAPNVCGGERVVPLIEGRPKRVSAVVDPFAEEQRVTAVFRSESIGSTWNQIVGTDHGAPSRGVWQKTLVAKAGDPLHFVYAGLAPLFSFLEPEALAGLDLRGCWSALLVDRCSNDVASRERSKRESMFSCSRIEMLRPLETAGLLSLLGVNAIALNQWANSIRTNVKLAHELGRVLEQKVSGKEASLCQAVQAFARKTSHRIQNDEDSEGEVNAEQASLSFKNRVKLNTVVYGVPML